MLSLKEGFDLESYSLLINPDSCAYLYAHHLTAYCPRLNCKCPISWEITTWAVAYHTKGLVPPITIAEKYRN